MLQEENFNDITFTSRYQKLSSMVNSIEIEHYRRRDSCFQCSAGLWLEDRKVQRVCSNQSIYGQNFDSAAARNSLGNLTTIIITQYMVQANKRPSHSDNIRHTSGEQDPSAEPPEWPGDHPSANPAVISDDVQLGWLGMCVDSNAQVQFRNIEKVRKRW